MSRSARRSPDIGGCATATSPTRTASYDPQADAGRAARPAPNPAAIGPVASPALGAYIVDALKFPTPTLIPAVEAGWVQQVHCFGSEVGMDGYVAARPDVYFTGPDGSLRSNRALCQAAGLYACDLFIGSTLQIDLDGNSSTFTADRVRALAEMASRLRPDLPARSLEDFRSLEGVRAWAAAAHSG